MKIHFRYDILIRENREREKEEEDNEGGREKRKREKTRERFERKRNKRKCKKNVRERERRPKELLHKCGGSPSLPKVKRRVLQGWKMKWGAEMETMKPISDPTP